MKSTEQQQNPMPKKNAPQATMQKDANVKNKLSMKTHSVKAFANEKKTFLSKIDKSKKGGIDVRAIPLLETINSYESMFSTSSCSGRVYLWRGSGKKNETEWVTMSHDPISESFFGLDLQVKEKGVVWIRFESSIFHVCCDTIETANWLLLCCREHYKRSAILSASNKIIVEIKGGDIIEMPLYVDGICVFSGDVSWLTALVNTKMDLMWKRMDAFKVTLAKEKLKK